MKKIILAAAVFAFLFAGAPAFAKGKHPNLTAAHNLVVKAQKRIADAQKANEYDLGGHAAKAKDLLDQAEQELAAALAAAKQK